MIKSCFLLSWTLLLGLMPLYAEKVLDKGAESGVPPRELINSRVARALPGETRPLRWSLRVVPGQILNVAGELENTDKTRRYLQRAVVAIIKFQDKKGDVIVSQALPREPKGGGNYVYLDVAARPLPFLVEVQVPEGAERADVLMAKTVPRQNVVLNRLVCLQTQPSSLLVKLAVACALLVIPLVFLCLNRRLANRRIPIGTEIVLPRDSGLLVRIWRLGVTALAIAMAVVFVRNLLRVLERYKPQCSLSFVIGYLLLMALLAVFLYLLACNRRRFAVLTIMTTCFLLNVVVIRTTHVLYSQTMYHDFGHVARALLAPDVRVEHAFMFFYWCNYELLCSFLGKIFCRDIQVAQYLNAVCVTAAIFPVFKLSEKVGGFAIAIFTSLLMGCSPLLLVYGTILTNELLAASLLTFAFYFIVKASAAEESNLRLRAAFFAGGFLGMAHLIKPIAAIFVAAVFVIAMLELARFGWNRLFRCSAVLGTMVGVFVIVSECGQSACTEIAKPQIIEKSTSGNIVGSLLTGLNVETHGHWDPQNTRRIVAMTKDERIAALKNLLVKNYRRLPSLFLEKLDCMYSDFADFVCYIYMRTTERALLPKWLTFIVFGWHFLMLGLITLGVTGIVVARKVSEERNLVGIMVLLVVGGFTVTLLLLEINERYMSVVYPILFLVIPYARVWFEKDNRLYQGVVKMVRRFKAWGSRRHSVPQVQSLAQEKEEVEQ